MYSDESLGDIKDFGLISLMYHRFEENKYPSTNIRINNFVEHLDLIKKKSIEIHKPK